jgi:hypothetical protein
MSTGPCCAVLGGLAIVVSITLAAGMTIVAVMLVG